MPSNNGENSVKEERKHRRRSPDSSRSSSRERDAHKRRKHRNRSRSREERRSRSPHESKRLHIGNLDESVRRRDIEDTFGKFGKLTDVWMASYPPYFAFVVYERGADATTALREMQSGYVRDCRVRTSIALPRQNMRLAPSPPPRRRRSRSRSRSPTHRSRRSRSGSPSHTSKKHSKRHRSRS